MVVIGMVLAFVIILIDLWLEKRGSVFRAPILAVAVGIYLPLELSVPIFLGGIISAFIKKTLKSKKLDPDSKETKEIEQRGMLISSGLITGEALVGILMAIPIVLSGKSNVVAIFGVHDYALPGILVILLLMYALYKFSIPKKLSR